MSVSILEQAKIQARVLVPLVKALQAERERFYAEYSLYVAELAHQAHFRHEPA